MKNLFKIFIIFVFIFYFLNTNNLVFANNSLTIDKTIDVPKTCEVLDLDGNPHVYGETGDSYLGICALDVLLDANHISNLGLSNQYPDMGLFVTSFNEIVADPSSQYWALYQNNAYASSGISTLEINQGDIISFKLSDFSGVETGDSVVIRINSLIEEDDEGDEEAGGGGGDNSLTIDKTIDVPKTCEVLDLDGNPHVYGETGDSYLGICALDVLLDANHISNLGLSNQYPDMGLFVTSFNEIVADPSSQYWALYQNNAYASSGISTLEINQGDIISFKLSDFSGVETGDSVVIRINSLIEEDDEGDEEVGGGGGGGSNSRINHTKSLSIENAISFLSDQYQKDKSLGEGMYFDWFSVAIGSERNSSLKKELINYYKLISNDSLIITDNERRAMALMSLGINPYNGTEINYIKKIIDSFNGIQLGEDDLINDDIFGLIVLSHAGYSYNDEIIRDIISHIISNQSSNGSWGSVDMTAAGIQALNNFDNLDKIEESISMAELFLKNSQGENGGFGNLFSTSWAVQALSENDFYEKEIDNAIKYLLDNQKNDGSFNIEGEDINHVWITSYIIPAILELSWNDILNYFDKENLSFVIKDEKKEEIILEPILSPVVLSLENKEIKIKEKSIEKIYLKKEIDKNKEKIKSLIDENSIINRLESDNILPLTEKENKSFFEIDKILKIIIIPFVLFWEFWINFSF